MQPVIPFYRRIRWRWVIVGVLAVVTFLLGYFGFAKHSAAVCTQKTVWDKIYLSVQLFTIESGAVDGPVNLQLQTARFLAPIVSAYAVVNALIGLFSLQIQRLWIRLWGDHVIVCGIGRKGFRLAEQLRQRGDRVVVIEPDEHLPGLKRCRDVGCFVIPGHADDPWNLQKAHIDRAKTIIAVAGEDGINVETAVRAHGLVQGRRGDPLRCITHVSDPYLQTIFGQHQIFADKNDPFDLEFFNTYKLGARVMLRESCAFGQSPPVVKRNPHFLIVGAGQLGEALLVRGILDWQIERRHDEEQLHITVIDAAANERSTGINQRYPDVLAAASVAFLNLDVHSHSFSNGKFLRDGRVPREVTDAFVCLDNDASAVYAAMELRRCLAETASVVTRMSEEAGLATLLGTASNGDGPISGVSAIGLMDITCQLEFVLGGTREILAQAIHQGYVEHQQAEGQTVADNPSMRPWHEIPETLRESNRRQADDIRDKLKAIGCKLDTIPSGVIDLFEFSTDEIESLARVEHESWMAERLADGWKFGKSRDAKRRTNPHLVPWIELPDTVKDYNRNAIRHMPKALAKADFEIRRA